MLTLTQTLFILSVLFIHWFADFVCQTDWQAKNKSSNNKALLLHVTTYSLVWLLISFVIFYMTYKTDIIISIILSIIFTSITFVCHFITDYITSRLNSKLWSNGKVHNFFVSIGFDQVLHYIQLFFTFYLLFI